MLIKDASVVWNTLRGIICVYKPAEIKVDKIREKIMHAIITDLNEMKVRPPENYVNIIGHPSKELQVTVQQNLADHPMVVGPRYQKEDLFMSWSNYLGWNTSGVLLFGLRSGTRTSKFIRENLSTRAYRIKGVLGTATENGYKDGKVIEKSTWRFLTQYHLDRMLSAMQAAHQKKMFDLCGVDMQSQLAYELAVKGPIRPRDSKIPVVYGIKCIEFDAPNFTLELQCINENEKYLIGLINEIGMKLHSTAHCTGIQCIRHSHFNLEHALLKKHWNLQHIVTNLEQCNKILEDHSEIVLQHNVALV